jgi:2-iminobutanoate/2-iminopropanoate deaminase
LQGYGAACYVEQVIRPLRHVVIGRGSTMGGDDALIADAVQFGDLLFLSGRAAVDPGTLAVVDGGFDAQAQRVLDDVDAVLAGARATRSDVLRVECFLADAADFPAWNAAWREYFSPPRPARTTVVCEFAVPGILIELQVTAGLAGGTA